MSILTEKWAEVLDHAKCPRIADERRREVTAILLENQAEAMRKEGARVLSEGMVSGGMATGAEAPVHDGVVGVAGYDKVLINLVRRAMPQLIAFDVCGVQPMTSPTGLVFALNARYADGREALFNEIDASHSGNAASASMGAGWDALSKGAFGVGMSTAEAESRDRWNQMGFSIERTAVIARSRQLKAQYSIELAQDLKAVHGLDAEAELSNILATEILTEMNREIIRSIYVMAKPGCMDGMTAEPGVYNLDVDSDGRWSAEKFKGLMYRIELEANAIAQDTRRGRGNFIICSSAVASALQMAGMLSFAPEIQANLSVDEASSTFAGVLNGKYKVFVDPYMGNGSADQYFVVGYKGQSPFDAGMFYCPYVPLQAYRATNPEDFTPALGFKTRYGIVANPMVQTDKYGQGEASVEDLANENYFFRKVLVRGLA
jgi:hypothetical protein